MMSKNKKGKIPVTILTGFLGSGKTTLLNHILSSKHGLKLAVIENQFGEVGVDEHLVKQNVYSEQQVIETMNGCICCTVRGDLSKILIRLLIEQKRTFDGIIIETTGMADPAPVAQTFFVDDQVSTVTVLDGIITVVDSKHIIQHLNQEKPEGAENQSVEQIAFADRIILNKTDLVTKEQLQIVKKQIGSINSTAEIILSQYSKVDPDKLLNIQAFNLQKVLEMDSQFLNTDQQHVHDQTISSCGCIIEEPISLGKLQRWISQLIQEKATDLFRYKGVINVAGMPSPYVFQGVHMLFTGNFIKNGWDQGKPRQTYFCFIGKNIDKEYLINGFKNCIATKLNYSIGDKVQCLVESGPFGWKEGKIIALWDQGNPYRIRLLNGSQVHCPDDTPLLIRLKQKGFVTQEKQKQILEEIENTKTLGNQYFSLQKYELAIGQYTKGLVLIQKKKIGLGKNSSLLEDLSDLMIKFKINISLCYLRTGKFEESIKVCNFLITQKQDYSRAYYVKGKCQMGLKKYQEAKETLQRAQKYDSSNPQILNSLEECKQKLKK